MTRSASAPGGRPLHRRGGAARGWWPALAVAGLLLASGSPGIAQPAPAARPRSLPAPPPVPMAPPIASPQPAGGVIVQDRTHDSPALARQMTYRVLLPPGYFESARRYPVLYLLHGLTGAFTDWEQRTQLTARLEAYQLIVVMPEALNSWYVDSVAKADDRFETYILDDLVADVDRQYRTIGTRHGRAIAGLSMGGYGAMTFALKRPGAFLVAGSFSGAFSIIRAGAPAGPAAPPPDENAFSRVLRESVTSAVGLPGSAARAANDLFALAKKADVARLPYLYVDCGTEDGLLQVNREFTALLHERKVPYEYHESPGAHTWDYWDRRIVEFLRVAARVLPIEAPPRRR